MTFLIALLFVTSIIFSTFVILTSFKKSMPRIIDIIEDRNAPMTAAPIIRLGQVKHRKMASNVQASNNVVTLPLNLTHKCSDNDAQKAA